MHKVDFQVFTKEMCYLLKERKDLLWEDEKGSKWKILQYQNHMAKSSFDIIQIIPKGGNAAKKALQKKLFKKISKEIKSGIPAKQAWQLLIVKLESRGNKINNKMYISRTKV